MQEIDEREEHAHDGCEEQGYDAHLYDTRCLEVKEPAKDAAQRMPPPTRAMAQTIVTPHRRVFPISFFMSRFCAKISFLFSYGCILSSELTGKTVVYHVDCHKDDGYAEDFAQQADIKTFE